ncbi:hypothetical protein BH09ACT5_BH09ACT5_07120 [soil metagenome]
MDRRTSRLITALGLIVILVIVAVAFIIRSYAG